MKKADLEKLKGAKISSQIKRPGAADRFGSGSGAVPDRREQRKLDQALGLVPFAVKLDSELIKELHALTQSRDTNLNDLVAELLRKGLKN